MIISRTPFRISFFGGGTDYPVWYRENGGEVLATTIDKYCYLTCRKLPPFFDHTIRVVYSKIENCRSVDEIKHPAAREVLRHRGVEGGIEIHHDGDLPARSGIGSSSSFTVGLLNAVAALQGRPLSRHQLAMESIYIEQDILKETVGSQDQVLAAYGGFNHIVFSPTGTITVTPVKLHPEFKNEFQDHWMLFYTGIDRSSSKIAQSYVKDFSSRKSGLDDISRLAREAAQLINAQGEFRKIGALLHEAWKIKSSWSTAVANSEIKSIYDAAREAGAYGGKLTGAGGGGFLLLMVPTILQARVRAALSRLLEVPFRFESSGSRIIFNGSENDPKPEMIRETAQASL